MTERATGKEIISMRRGKPIGLEPTKETFEEHVQRALEELRTPIVVNIPNLHTIALEECNGNVEEARVVYEMAGAAIRNLKEIERLDSVFQSLMRHAGIGEKALKQVLALKNEHLQLQQKIGVAMVTKELSEVAKIPKYMEDCDVIMRTLLWLISASMGKAFPQSTEEDINDQVAEFLVGYMEFEFKHKEVLKQKK